MVAIITTMNCFFKYNKCEITVNIQEKTGKNILKIIE